MRATAQELIDRATTASGLTDFGPAGWRDGLDQMIVALAVDVPDDDAAARVEDILVDKLVTRLRIEQWYADHGDEAAHPVAGPLVIMGLPRTATTATHYLLALDPQLRYLRTWERNEPLPPPDLATERDDPRRIAVEESTMHIRTVDGPAEDGPVQMLDFRSSHGLPLPSFGDWWRANRHPTAVAYQDRVMRLLHARRPPYYWLLKYPNYAYQLNELVGQWPDAKFIWTHRDPRQLIPSTCSVTVDGYRRRIPDWAPADWSTFGHEQLARFAEAARRAVSARALIGDDRFIDIGQNDMQTDAVGVAARIYDFAGLTLTDDMRTTMAAWAADNAKGSRGEHAYTAAQYGLTDDEILEAFSEYLERFGECCAEGQPEAG
jgi:hypothetical protein